MSKVKIQGNASGTGIFTVAAPATNTDRTITLPDIQGTAVIANANNQIGLGTTALPTDSSLVTTNGIKMNISNPGQRRVYALGATSSNYELNVSGGAAVLFDRISGSDELAFETHYTGYWHREQMRITKEGYVITPYRPTFEVGPSNNITLPGGSDTKLTFASIKNNNGGFYNSSNGRFTAPISGTYFFYACGTIYSGTTDQYLTYHIKKNNSDVSGYGRGATSGGQYESAPIMCTVQLAANDYIELFGYSQAGSAYAHPESRFGGYFLG